VPERTAFVIERFGKYARTLTPGLHVLIPFVSLSFWHMYGSVLNNGIAT